MLELAPTEDDGVAGSIRVLPLASPHSYLRSTSVISREDRVTISRWQLGIVGQHCTCARCGLECSREHVMECAGVNQCLTTSMRVIYPPPTALYGLTPMDWLLNAAALDMLPAVATELVDAITRIERVCRARTRTERGFFTSM